MSDKLTDEQVAELVEECAYHDGNGWRTLPDFVEALALEVQQARQRRCGNCRYYGEARGETDNDGECNNPTIGFLGGVFIPSTWGCADFTPKEER